MRKSKKGWLTWLPERLLQLIELQIKCVGITAHEYIAFSLFAPGAAKNQAGCIMEAIAKLNKMPYRYSLYEKEPWQSKGLRVLPVGNYLAFYLPVESRGTVAVIRIMYGGRSIDEQLSRTEVNEF